MFFRLFSWNQSFLTPTDYVSGCKIGKILRRPIYVRMMIYAMQEQVKEKNFDQLNEWLTFCEWVLTHIPTKSHEGDHIGSEESQENPDWS